MTAIRTARSATRSSALRALRAAPRAQPRRPRDRLRGGAQRQRSGSWSSSTTWCRSRNRSRCS